MDKFVNVNLHMTNFACKANRNATSALADQFKNMKYSFPKVFPSMAFEVNLVNKKLIRLFSASRSFLPHVKNTIDTSSLPDCQLDSSWQK